MIDIVDGMNICLSGGAEGADLQWGMCAGSRGDKVIHFIFDGHRSRAPSVEKVVLSGDMLAIANPHLEKANKSLCRKWPVANNFVASLLRRNYYQVAWAGSVYAISEIGKDQRVKGGTAWAVQMYIDLHPDGKAYVFDQKKEQWFQWKNGWCPIISPPPPEGVWAGVGSRDLVESGKNAIRELLGWKNSRLQGVG